VQRFESIRDYQAGSWARPRAIIAKLEVNSRGSNRRFVVHNLSGHPQGINEGFYVQRGDVPESPIGELKKGLEADRLSAHGFRANALRLLEHVLAYAVVVLYRAAAAAAVPEVATAEGTTLRQRLWKVGAVVRRSVRAVWFQFSETWPFQELWGRVHQAVMAYAARVQESRAGLKPLQCRSRKRRQFRAAAGRLPAQRVRKNRGKRGVGGPPKKMRRPKPGHQQPWNSLILPPDNCPGTRCAIQASSPPLWQ
jgi:hypothetical protein